MKNEHRFRKAIMNEKFFKTFFPDNRRGFENYKQYIINDSQNCYLKETLFISDTLKHILERTNISDFYYKQYFKDQLL